MTRIDVACAAEGRAFARHSAAMLQSLLAHNRGDHLWIHYLPGPGIGPEEERGLRRMVESAGASISFRRPPAGRLEGIPTRGFTREATWYRILLPELLPDVARVLYLDTDLFVLDRLEPLWSLDLTGSWVGAVTNVLEPIYAERPAALGLEPDAYFNAGVLLFNLAEMRRDGCTEALRDYAVRHADELMWRDQDALNAVLGTRRLALHPRWNCMNSVMAFPQAAEVFEPGELAEARARPAVRHFEGPGENKPWHFLGPSDGRRLYREHRRATPWPRFVPDGVTARNVMRRLRLDRRPLVRESVADR